MTYLLVGLAVALCGLVGYSVYLTRTSEKRFSKQVNLLLTAQHASLSETKSASTKIDWLRYEQDQALEYQKKTFEQQRVLLASLNRQVRRIDDIYKSRPGDAVSSQKPRIPVAKPHPALARQQGQASNGQETAANDKPVSLADLFRQNEGFSLATGSNQRQAAHNSKIIKNMNRTQTGQRRVSNG